jgi:hypothetical protein
LIRRDVFVLAVLATAALPGSWSNSQAAAKPNPYIAISPSPTHVGETLSFSGCNYGGRPKDVAVLIYGPDGSQQYGFATHTDETGCFAFVSGYTPPVSGVYEAYVFPDRSAGDGQGTYNYNHPTVDYDFEVLH